MSWSGFAMGAEADRGSFLTRLGISGYFKNETAFRFDEPRSLTKIRNILYLEGRYHLWSNVDLFASGWGYYDLVYDLFEYDTIAARDVRDEQRPLVFVNTLAEEKDQAVADFRELYLDLVYSDVDVRIGKQFTIWGVIDGIRVVDEINPMDFRELILLDLLEYRIPVWTLKVDYHLAENDFEMLWIPDIRFHRPAPRGSEWELLQRVPNTKNPDSWNFENSEYGLRWSTEHWDTDISLSYFYTWDDFPTIFRNVRVNSPFPPQFEPTFTRIHMLGTTLVRPFGRYVVKGEMAYVKDKYFGILSTTDKNQDGILDNRGELRKDHIRWALGLDFNMFTTDFSPSIVQWVILDYDKAIIQKEFDTAFNLFVRKVIKPQVVTFNMLLINLISLHETYVKPKFTFSVTGRFQVETGLDLFFGEPSAFGPVSQGGGVSNLNVTEERAQFFGNFHDNDRVFANFTYSF